MGNDAGLYAVRKSYPFPGAVASRRTRGRTWYCEEDFLGIEGSILERILLLLLVSALQGCECSAREGVGFAFLVCFLSCSIGTGEAMYQAFAFLSVLPPEGWVVGHLLCFALLRFFCVMHIGTGETLYFCFSVPSS